MIEKSLSDKVISGVFWKFFERISSQLVTFIVSLILARILEPEDYGSIALITIFITIANVFVVSGFGNSLIQKKNADNLDFSSVFYFNIIFSCLVYSVIYFGAPYIAKFYNSNILTSTLRILSLKIILSGINSVQQAYVSKNMLFKKFFLVTFIGTILSAIIGIIIAILGGGVWALVAQQLSNAFMDTVILWFVAKWRPLLKFDLNRLKLLISYGWKILATNLVNSIYDNLKNLIIGKKYSSLDLAFYSKGKQFPEMIVTNINSSIGSVLFPAMSLIQDDSERLKFSIRKSIKLSSFLLFPLMAGLFVIADDFVTILLTEKWSFSINYLRIACIYLSTYPINTANLQALNAIGRSDYYLKLEIIKRGVGVILILITMKYGVFWMALSDIIVSFIAILINTYPNKTILNYPLYEQLFDLIPNMLRSIVMAFIVFIINLILKEYVNIIIIRLILNILIGIFTYIILCIVTKSEDFKFIINSFSLIIKR